MSISTVRGKVPKTIVFGTSPGTVTNRHFPGRALDLYAPPQHVGIGRRYRTGAIRSGIPTAPISGSRGPRLCRMLLDEGQGEVANPTADVAAVQHRECSRRGTRQGVQPSCADPPEPHGLAHSAGRVVPAEQPRSRVGGARFPGVLPWDGPLARIDRSSAASTSCTCAPRWASAPSKPRCRPTKSGGTPRVYR